MADSVLTILSGSAKYFAYEEEPPNLDVCYASEPDAVVVPPALAEPGTPSTSECINAGAVAITPAGIYYGLINNGLSSTTALVVTGPDAAHSVYTVRTPT